MYDKKSKKIRIRNTATLPKGWLQNWILQIRIKIQHSDCRSDDAVQCTVAYVGTHGVLESWTK
jgi:hypothetical protein